MNLAFMSTYFSMLTGTTGNVASDILAVLSLIGDWIVETIPKFFVLFYSPDSGLTVVGVLCCCGLGVGVILLLVNKVSDFFHWRS